MDTIVTAPPAETTLLKAADVAKILQCSEDWVIAHATGRKQPAIPCLHIGRLFRFRPCDVVEFINTYTSLPRPRRKKFEILTPEDTGVRS